MAEQTTNLGLTKPAENEAYSVPIVNANSEKIDQFAGDCINTNLGSFASLTALATILDTALSSMRSAGVKAFQVNCTTASAPFKVLTYLCTLYKSGTNTTFAHATFRSVSSSEVIIARRTSNGWGEWQQLAMASQLENTNANDCATGVASGDSFTARKVGKILVLNFMGASRTYAEDELLFTLSSGYRPAARVKFNGSIGAIPVIIDVATDGKCTICLLRGATTTSRLYFQGIVPIA